MAASTKKTNSCYLTLYSNSCWMCAELCCISDSIVRLHCFRLPFCRALSVLITAKARMRKYQKNGDSIPTIFAKTVQKHPNKVALIEVDGRQWTFREVDEYSNAIANCLYEAGFRYGDVVALFYENRPEFVCYWLGMAKIGVCAALINFSLKKDSLAHCIKISEAKGVIYGQDQAEGMYLKAVSSEKIMH